MVVLNGLDRFHLVSDVIDRVPGLGARAAYAQQAIHEKLIEHKQYITKYGHAGHSGLDMESGGSRKAPARQISRGLPKKTGVRSIMRHGEGHLTGRTACYSRSRSLDAC